MENNEIKKEATFWQKYKKEIIIGCIAMILLVFIVQNSGEVEFWLVVTPVKVSLIILILFFYALGILTAGVYGHYRRKELKKKIKELEK
jgi:uncharacterized integral membrane protein